MKTHLHQRIVAGLAVAALALAACGDDDGGGGGSQQDEVADFFIDALSEGGDGVEADEGCIRDLAAQLSDDDAQAILDAGPDGEPNVSDEADELGVQLLDCIDFDLSEIDLDLSEIDLGG